MTRIVRDNKLVIMNPFQKDDFNTIVKFADTLLRLKLVEHDYGSDKMSSYMEVCNLGQLLWSRYRDRHEIGN